MKMCKVVGHARTKAAAQKTAMALRRRGHKARVAGSRGKYAIMDCGMRKRRRRMRRHRA